MNRVAMMADRISGVTHVEHRYLANFDGRGLERLCAVDCIGLLGGDERDVGVVCCRRRRERT
jgi:hypothetical protein